MSTVKQLSTKYALLSLVTKEKCVGMGRGPCVMPHTQRYWPVTLMDTHVAEHQSISTTSSSSSSFLPLHHSRHHLSHVRTQHHTRTCVMIHDNEQISGLLSTRQLLNASVYDKERICIICLGV